MALLDDIGVSWTRSAFLDDYLRVTSLQAIRDAGLFRDGSCAVQDESAGIVVQAVNPQPGEVIVDACAAPGGKLIRMGMLMHNEGRLIAVDPNEERLAMAVKSARQHGITIVEPWCGDFTEFRLGRADRVDKVLIDAPCTGLGVLARRADLRWQKTRDSFTDLMALQDKLLDRAVDVVNSGGLVTYATCTISPEENNDRIVALLDRNGGVVRHALPDSIPKSILDANGQLATLPHRDDIDGAFAATVQKR